MSLPSEEEIVAELKEIFDPEIPINIVDLGLIRKIERKEEDNTVHIDMTMTSMGCPTLEEIRLGVESRTRSLPGVEDARVDVVWTPPWTPDDMTEDGKFGMQSMGLM